MCRLALHDASMGRTGSPSMTGLYRLGLSLFAIVLLLLPPARLQKQKLTIGAIVPDHSFLRRTYKTTLNRAVFSFRGDRFSLNDNYTFASQMIFLNKYSPREILSTLCKLIQDAKVNTILYLSNADHLGEHTASGQYLLQTSNFMGIPVIAWNGDNSGFFQVRGDLQCPLLNMQFMGNSYYTSTPNTPSHNPNTQSRILPTHFHKLVYTPNILPHIRPTHSHINPNILLHILTTYSHIYILPTHCHIYTPNTIPKETGIANDTYTFTYTLSFEVYATIFKYHFHFWNIHLVARDLNEIHKQGGVLHTFGVTSMEPPLRDTPFSLFIT